MVSCLQKFDSNFGDYFRVKTKNQSSMNEKLPLVISQLVKLVPTTKLLQKMVDFLSVLPKYIQNQANRDVRVLLSVSYQDFINFI